MLEINYLEHQDRKRMNEEARQVKADEIPDPLTELPKKFHAVAKVINDGKDIVVYLPKEYVGRYMALEATHGNAFFIVAGTGFPVVAGHYTDEDQNVYGGQLRLPSEVMHVPLKRTGAMRHVCTRLARKIIFGDMLNKLTSGYAARKTAPTTYLPRDPANMPQPIIPVAQLIVPSPMPSVKVDTAAAVATHTERETLRMAQGIINDAIRTKGYTAHIQPDNTIKLTMEI